MWGRMANLKKMQKKALKKKLNGAAEHKPQQQTALQAEALKQAKELLKEAERQRELGNVAEAEAGFKDVIRVDPTSRPAYAGWAEMAALCGNTEFAVKVLQELEKLDADYVYKAGVNIGVKLNQRARFKEAVVLVSVVLKMHEKSPEAYACLIGALAMEHSAVEALALGKKALEFCDFSSENTRSKAILYQQVGRCYAQVDGDFEKAIDYYEKALELDDTLPELYLSYAGAKKHKEAPEKLIAHAQTLLKKKADDLQVKKVVGAALAKIYNDLGDYDTAMEYSDVSNAAYAEDRPYSPEAEEKLFIKTRQLFTKEFLASCPKAQTEHAPVFILGPPRAGSTLLQQMLGKHSKIAPGDELLFMLDILKACNKEDYLEDMAHFTQETLDKFADFYAKSVEKYKTGNEVYVLDKQPYNYKFVGLMCRLFPNAKVIHTRRHPLDVALSSYMTGFQAGNLHTSKWEWLQHFQKLYEGYMKHWHEACPIAIHDVYYPDVVQNTEETIRAVVAYLGLDWEDACLSPEASASEVKTASAWQARQKIYTGSLERWKRYEAHLEPHMVGFKPFIESFESRNYADIEI